MRFLPKNEDLLEELNEHARLLAELVRARGATDAAAAESWLRRSHEITLRLLRSLRTTFITPLDRDDLYGIARGLEEVVRAAAQAGLEPPSDSADQTVGWRDAVRLVSEAVQALKDEKTHDDARTLSFEVLERDFHEVLRSALPDASADRAPVSGELVKSSRVVATEREVVAACARVADAILIALLDS